MFVYFPILIHPNETMITSKSTSIFNRELHPKLFQFWVLGVEDIQVFISIIIRVNTSV